MAFKHILTATDFSEASRSAVELAATLARESGARLTVTHACEVPAYTELAFAADLLGPAVAEARSNLDALAAPLRETVPEVTCLVTTGTPWEQILATAADAKADLVVLGTHGRRGLAHALLGSVAERVVRLSPVPVLTVRPPG